VLRRLQTLLRVDKIVSPQEESPNLEILPESLFRKFLCLERKRTERSGRRFVLMLVHTGALLQHGLGPVFTQLTAAITSSTRDTDLMGWYRHGSAIGVIFTEIQAVHAEAFVQTISGKIASALRDRLNDRQIGQIHLTFHAYPEDRGSGGPEEPIDSTLYPDLTREKPRHVISLTAKRLVDVAGSIAGIVLLLPLMILVAIAIKLTSKGPVLFRQVRIGQYGRRFTFLKFRSMYVNNDPSVHEKYIHRFIKGIPGTEQLAAKGRKLYKLTADSRVTRVGRLIRKTSLDELPQLVNVLRGEMSLVGPRPPIIYEFERYDLWHRGRLLAVKPGITGLWQVHGRSRVKFDEMVRLDIRYARTWSLWLDFKILLQTPRAVVLGTGAH